MKTTKEKIINDLIKKRKQVEKQNENDIGSQRVYVNLPLPLIERTFFDIVAKEVYNKDQTKVFRAMIKKMMAKHPEYIKIAKERVKKEYG